jgi:hypothetical protein
MAPPQPSASNTALQRFVDLDVRPPKPKPSYPPISSIPPTSPARIAAATPDVSPEQPILSSSRVPGLHDAPAGSTILYLAYGSNLCAKTFLGRRGIRPLSQLNVSAPSLRLTFDLPGFPYREPCFANTALRKLPDKPPPGLPIPTPDPPKFPPVPPGLVDEDVERRGGDHWTHAHGDPVWPHGLVGVVYEVTPEDYAQILKTEGGGASYTDILVPCTALPAPRVGVPERPPPIPELPRPFLARTLFAPRLPDDGDEASGLEPGTVDEGGEGDKCKKPDVPPWIRRLLRPVRRPDPEYAQPSARYLQLLRDGAKEHDLPDDYQAYLAALKPYTVTTRRQTWGALALGLFCAPPMIALFGLSRLLADKQGRMPLWLAVAMGTAFNLIWTYYDYVLKPVFGDGERTEESADDRRRRQRTGACKGKGEEEPLLG